MDKSIKTISRVFKPVWGNIIFWLIIVLSVILNHLDFFHLKNRMSDWLIESIYAGFSILLSVVATPIIVRLVDWILKTFGLDEYVGTSPNIKVVKAYSDERIILRPVDSQLTAGTASTASADYAITGSPSRLLNMQIQQDWRETACYFAHVVLENKERKWGQTKTAYQVTANIRLLDENNKDIVDSFIGRWGNQMRQPDRRSVITSEEFTSINMLANGRSKYELNIAMKYSVAAFMVAFNNESYLTNHNNLMLPDRAIRRNNVIVEVVLKADNMDEELNFRFDLLNMGIGNGLEIKQIPEF